MKPKPSATITAMLLALLAACSTTPDAGTAGIADPRSRSEAGVQAALSEVIATQWHGPYAKDQMRKYCDDLITSAEKARDVDCKNPKGSDGYTWKDLTETTSVTIDGDTATITWEYTGYQSVKTQTETDTFHYEGGRWRWYYADAH